MVKTDLRETAGGLVVAAGLLLGAGCASDGAVTNNPDTTILEDLLAAARGSDPAVAVVDAFDVDDADARRRAIAMLASQHYGGEDVYLAVYRTIITDPDPTVRAACAAALGRHGGPEDVPLITPLLREEQAYLRWEAAKALRLLHNPVAVPGLLAVLRDDEDTDVRRAAAEALGQYPRSEVFDALVSALSDADFGVVHAAHRSLSLLTGRDAGLSPGAWAALAEEVGRERLLSDPRPYLVRQYDGTSPWLLRNTLIWRDKNPQSERPPAGM